MKRSITLFPILIVSAILFAVASPVAAGNSPASSSAEVAQPTAGEAEEKKAADAENNGEVPPCHQGHATLEAGKPLDDESIYQLESRWTASDGKEIGLVDLRGKVRVLAIFYASCDYACPILVGRMKSLQAQLPEDRRDRVGYVLVSMDPARDTPEKLAAYAERMKLEGDWTLLHGQDGDVRELGALLGFRYRRQPDGGFSHSNLITVLDREGRVQHQIVGLDTDLGAAVEVLTPLLGP